MCSICSYSLILNIEMFSKRCKTAHVCHFSFEQLEQCGLRTPQCTIQGSIGKPDNKMALKVQISQIVGYKFLLAFWTLQSQGRSLFPWSYAHFQHYFSIFEEPLIDLYDCAFNNNLCLWWENTFYNVHILLCITWSNAQRDPQI